MTAPQRLLADCHQGSAFLMTGVIWMISSNDLVIWSHCLSNCSRKGLILRRAWGTMRMAERIWGDRQKGTLFCRDFDPEIEWCSVFLWIRMPCFGGYPILLRETLSAVKVWERIFDNWLPALEGGKAVGRRKLPLSPDEEKEPSVTNHRDMGRSAGLLIVGMLPWEQDTWWKP